jgi:hypothetical protein
MVMTSHINFSDTSQTIEKKGNVCGPQNNNFLAVYMRSSYASVLHEEITILTPLGKRSLKVQIGSVFDQIT